MFTESVQILPAAGDAPSNVGLTTQPALGADLSGYTCHFGGERVEAGSTIVLMVSFGTLENFTRNH